MDSATMKHHIQAILRQHQDQLDSLTPKTVRFALEDLVGCERDALKAQKNEISDMIQTCLAQQQEEQEDDEQRPVKSEPASFSSMSAPAASASSGGAGKLAAQKQLNEKKRRALDDAAGDDDVDEDGQRAPPSNAKRSRGDEGASSGGDPNSVQLGQNKRIEVRSFKGMVLIDIREMYIDKTSGEEKPGKKGISLKPDQWAALVKNADKINSAIQKMQK